ncbi:hypothetical protein WDZ17_10385 [Pseudokineococcus basanitobsidens]|uniref:Uncharacterized protein n=1 Tax=Pseudokineococcus basanitobsidens TaxID=1926649 RepID=A0ABU8RKU9_9ACTN
MPTPQDDETDRPPAGSGDGAAGRGPAVPTISVNAAEQDPDPSEASSDPTARQAASDYDNDREDLPGRRSGG